MFRLFSKEFCDLCNKYFGDREGKKELIVLGVVVELRVLVFGKFEFFRSVVDARISLGVYLDRLGSGNVRGDRF